MNLEFSAHNEEVRISRLSLSTNNMPRSHNHASAEIYVLIRGERYLLIDNRFLKLRQGDAAIISPGVAHRTVDAGRCDYERLTVNIPLSLLPDGALPERTVAIYAPSGEEYEKALGELTSLIPSEGESFDSLKVYCAVLSFLRALLREPLAEGRSAASPTLDRVSEILDFVDTNYRENISLESLSERFYISIYHLSRLFKKYTGKTLTDYLRRLRITYAQYLLSGREAVSRVAISSGFGSVSAFAAAFRREVGLSPSAYRKMLIDKSGKIE